MRDLTQFFSVCGLAFVLMTSTAPADVIKMQFDLTGQATAYSGTVSPGHATGAFTGSDTAWNRIAPVNGNITGLQYSNGSAAASLIAQLGQPFTAGYQGPPGDSSWNYGFFVDAVTVANTSGHAIYDTSLMQNLLYREDNLGFRLKGLAPADYQVYVIAANPGSAAELNRTYNLSLGVNLEAPLPSPTAISAGASTSTWIDGKNYLLGTISITSSNQWLTVIQGGSAYPVLNGIQVIQVVPEPATGTLLALAGLATLRWRMVMNVLSSAAFTVVSLLRAFRTA